MLYGSPYGRYGEAAFGGSTSPKDGGSAVSGPSDDVIALRHLRAGGGDCFGRLIARWSSFMHVSVYLEAESPCQFPVFQTTHFGALVRLLFHELLGLQLRRLLRWSSIGAREGFYLLCSLLLEPWIKRQKGAPLSAPNSAYTKVDTFLLHKLVQRITPAHSCTPADSRRTNSSCGLSAEALVHFL